MKILDIIKLSDPFCSFTNQEIDQLWEMPLQKWPTYLYPFTPSEEASIGYVKILNIQNNIILQLAQETLKRNIKDRKDIALRSIKYMSEK